MQKETSTLSKKIKGYSALAGALLAITPAVNAQVIYKNIDPDSTASNDGGTFALDLNNDGTNDFKLHIATTVPPA